jgi:dsRNA-specific ribonuclease
VFQYVNVIVVCNDPKTHGTRVDDNSKTKCLEMYLNDFEPNFVFCQSLQHYSVLEKSITKRYYEAPKIISDVFEAILGAVFADGGYNEVIHVLQHILGPFV